ncbi:MAG: DUF2834 domain-containing protein [Microbacteriaceae bacterium]
MSKPATVRFGIFLTLAIIGFVTAMVFNGIAVTSGQDYSSAWFGTAVDWVLSADLSVVAIAAVVFMFAEAKRIGMKKVWVYVALSGVTAMAFTFPLFLAMRERRLSAANTTNTTADK